MHSPTYKINGFERRKVKKELNELKSYLRNFWHFHQLDKDMVHFYGGTEDYPMPDDEAKKRFENVKIKINKIEQELKVLLE